MIDLAELERLKKLATDGPWRRWDSGVWHDNLIVAICPAGTNDAEYITAVHNAMPALLECVKALKFYANENHIDDDYYIDEDGDEYPRTRRIEFGEKARAALDKLRQE